MENQQARNELIAELKRHGLPPAYIQRLLEELDDHLADMEEERSRKMNGARKIESTNTETQNANVISLHQRLGDPAQLAALAAKQYHNRSFLGRHPILTFVALPLPLILVCCAIVAAFLTGFGYCYDLVFSGNSDLDHPLILGIIVSIFFWAIIVLPPLATMAFLCRTTRRNMLNWRWAAIGCVLVSLYCSQIFVKWNHRPLNPSDKGIAMIWWGFMPTSMLQIALSYLPKFTVAVGISLLLIKRAQRLQKIDESRQEINASLRRAA